MTKFKTRNFIILLLALTILFSVTVCAAAAEEAPDNVTISAAHQEESAGESAPDSDITFSEHIEALRASLPELPNVDIYGWEFKLANAYTSIRNYAPPYGNVYGQGIDNRIADAVTAFIEAARNEGYEVYIYAGIRNIDYLYHHFSTAIRQYGSAWEAARHVAPPSTSEHQTGLCFDVTTNKDYSGLYDEIDNSAVLDTDAYRWMCEHCHEYGFIVRYPEGTEEYSGYVCHNGHFRYVGIDAATYIMENNLCLEEFIALYDESLVYVPDKKPET